MKKAKIGDIFEINTGNGIAYIQLIAEENGSGEFVRILPGIFEESKIDLQDIVQGEEMFSTFFPISFAWKKEMVKKVGHVSVPDEKQRIPIMRMGVDYSDKKPIHWTLLEGGKQVPSKDMEKERKIPIVNIPSFDTLQKWILQNEEYRKDNLC